MLPNIAHGRADDPGRCLQAKKARQTPRESNVDSQSAAPTGLARVGQRQPAVVEDVKDLADALVAHLADQGIDTYFGVPGGAIEPLFDALARQQRAGRARLILTRSEAGAAFAADGFYRETGRIAVCTGTTGPGISNLLTGVLSAHADRIPMLVVTPHVPSCKFGRGGLQDSSAMGYDLTRALSVAMRASADVSSPAQLPHLLRRLLFAAHGPPGGPVHLAISPEVLRSAPRGMWPAVGGTASPGQVIDIAALARVGRHLHRARRPVLYIGDDAGVGATALCDYAAQRGLSVVSSPAGKRWVSHHHAAYRGVCGFSGHAVAEECLRRADLVVAFGATFDELSTGCWQGLPDVPVYSVDGHCEHAHRMLQLQPVLGSIESALESIRFAEKAGAARASAGLRVVPSRPDASARPSVDPPAESAASPAAASPARPRTVRNGTVHPAMLMERLGTLLPDDVVVHVDAGNGFSWSTRHLSRRLPDTYRVAMGLSSMGWAIGAALGAAAGCPGRVLAVCGDGSLMMSSWELTVAVAERLPVTYLVLNDASLGMVRHGQALGGAERIASDLPPVRFDQVATACGANGARIESLQELERVAPLALATGSREPWVLDVQIDPEAIPPIADRVSGLAKR